MYLPGLLTTQNLTGEQGGENKYKSFRLMKNCQDEMKRQLRNKEA